MEIFKSNEEAIVKLIASEKTWIESEAVRQLETTAKLKGMKLAVGLPDLHPGKSAPIGAVFISDSYIYPHLVGNDIGCGMGLWETDLKASQIKLDKWVNKLDDLESKLELDDHIIEQYKYILPTNYDYAIGTIGGGNHFAELQKIESIIDEQEFKSHNLDKGKLFLLVHSGSRGLGESILSDHINKYGTNGLSSDTEEARSYIEKLNHAVKWAKLNRLFIAKRFLSCLRAEGDLILDVCHNSVTELQLNKGRYYLHRKGATPSEGNLVVIPGSRGDFSYLVKPLCSNLDHGFSLAHGAGRKWQRSDAKAKLAKFKKEDFIKTNLGSIVICESKDLIYEEAPQAYKKIDQIIQDLIDAKLIKIVAIVRPVITYKTRGNKC